MPSKKKTPEKVYCNSCLFFRGIVTDPETKEEQARCQHEDNIVVKSTWLQKEVKRYKVDCKILNKNNNCKKYIDGRTKD